jgi:DNA-binding XRE family transcriptional regulator
VEETLGMRELTLMGCNLVKVRKALGLTQVDLVKRAGLSRQTLIQLEKGPTYPKYNPTLRSVIKLTRALDITLYDLLNPNLEVKIIVTVGGKTVTDTPSSVLEV